MFVNFCFLCRCFKSLMVFQMQRSLCSSRAEYDRIHQRMLQELPQVLEERVEYFEHCLQAVIEAQVHIYIYILWIYACVYILMLDWRLFVLVDPII